METSILIALPCIYHVTLIPTITIIIVGQCFFLYIPYSRDWCPPSTSALSNKAMSLTFKKYQPLDLCHGLYSSAYMTNTTSIDRQFLHANSFNTLIKGHSPVPLISNLHGFKKIEAFLDCSLILNSALVWRAVWKSVPWGHYSCNRATMVLAPV